MKLLMSAVLGVCVGLSTAAGAQDLTWRKDIEPIIKAQCGECHGGEEPEFSEWNVKRASNKKLAPKMNTYDSLMGFVVWPATGAFMRRLDDGKSPLAGGKPGNMNRYLGETDAERAKNLATIKAWLGEGNWNLNRMEKRGDVPGLTIEQLGKVKPKY
jgi:hypothetical protein